MSEEKIPQQTDIEVGQRIRQRRKLLGVSQSTLAAQIGVTFQQVQKYEKGSNRVGSSRLHQIAGALGLTPSALFGEDGAAPLVPELSALLTEISASNETIALNRAFGKILDRDVRRAVVALIKAIGREDGPDDDHIAKV